MIIKRHEISSDTMPGCIGISINGVYFMTSGIRTFMGKDAREEQDKALGILFQALEDAGYEVST